MKNKTILHLLGALSVLAACKTPSSEPLGRILTEACPVTARDDVAARDRCADALTKSVELEDLFDDPFYWGSQAPGTSVAEAIEDSSVTDFNPFVWRRIYLSTYMFENAGQIENAGRYRVLRIPVRFRNELPVGEYPYPFWHSQKKWQAYQTAVELLFYFDGGRVIGALRSEQQDPSRPQVEHTFDGMWTWDDGKEPHVTLYDHLFSPVNPFVGPLEIAYRTLSDELRAETCMTCHSPDNSSMMMHLELLNYPNQALTGRHDLVRILNANTMPPGIGVPDLTRRAELIRLAETFARAGDDALAFEGASVPNTK